MFFLKEREVYLPLAETGSKLYFVISCLDVINNMYKFSLNSYLSIFQKALKKADVNFLILFYKKLILIFNLFRCLEAAKNRSKFKV